jgi:2-furoate---CoA ligase
MFDLGRTLFASVERNPQSLAIVDGSLRLSYAQWLDRIEHVAGALDAVGLRHGDHLVTVLQNRFETATLHWACQLLGIVITPLNWRATGDEIDYCLRDAEARAIACEGVTAAAIGAAKQARALLRIAVGDAPVAGGAHAFDAMLAAAPYRAGPRAHADDTSVMLYTSGTTGRPKGVPRRHRQERAAAIAHVAQNYYAPGEVTLGVMPLYHTMGVRSLLAMALVDGCFACLPRFDAERALAIIETERVTNLYLVPTLYHDLLSHAKFAATDVSSVQKLGFAGAPMSDGLLKRVDDAFRPRLFVTGRIDDMIISGGENISPADIESVLSLHPSVDEVAVAGLNDERWGQKVVAFVKVHDAVTAEALNAYCQSSDLLNFKRPREYVFVREIPKSPVGKILRRMLVAGEYETASAPINKEGSVQ